MKEYYDEELDEIIRLHKLWLDKEESGVKAVFTDCDLSDHRLINVDLTGAIVRNVDFINTKIIQSKLNSCSFYDCYMYESNFEGSEFFNSCMIGNRAKRIKLRATNFSFCSISDSNFRESCLSSTRFINTDINGSTFRNSDFSCSTFENTIFNDCEISDSSFAHCNNIPSNLFSYSKISNIDLNNSPLQNKIITLMNIGERGMSVTCDLINDVVFYDDFKGTIDEFNDFCKKYPENKQIEYGVYYLSTLRNIVRRELSLDEVLKWK